MFRASIFCWSFVVVVVGGGVFVRKHCGSKHVRAV